jgi:hypothetical protein
MTIIRTEQNREAAIEFFRRQKLPFEVRIESLTEDTRTSRQNRYLFDLLRDIRAYLTGGA